MSPDPAQLREAGTPGDAAAAFGVVRAQGIAHRYRAPSRRRRRRTAASSVGPAARGDEALAGVDLAFKPGTLTALLGPNGSGKSTLVRILAGVQAPTSGRVVYGGAPLTREGRRRVGVVFQQPALDRLLTVRETLVLAGTLCGLPRARAKDRAEAVARDLGLAARLDDRAGTLSGGLLRRADLARALLHEPEVLLLDEPTAGLDLQSRLGLVGALREAAAGQNAVAGPEAVAGRGGATVVFTTHHLDEAARAGRVVVMHRGRVVADGTPAALREAVGARRLRIVTGDGAGANPGGDSGGPGAGLGAGFPPELSRALGPARRTVVEPGGLSVYFDDERALAVAADAALRAGLALEIGPASLADVYLVHTGTRLGDEADGERAAPVAPEVPR